MAKRPPLFVFTGLGLVLLGCNTVLDIRPGRQTCGFRAPLCDDPNVAHWDPSAPKEYTVDDETVCDEVTGLQWARAPSAEALTLEDAAAYCKALSVDGQTGFRLPTRIELASIVDYSRSTPAMDGKAFRAPPESFWTSTVSMHGEGEQIVINFSDGQVDRAKLDAAPPPRVRCVRRDGEATAPTCGDPGCVSGRYCPSDGAMTDVETGLQWQVTLPAAGTGITRDAAQRRCEELTLSGGGWRLPRVEELQTLVEDLPAPGGTTDRRGAIDPQAFPGDDILTYFWSASDYATDGAQAWTVSFVDGAVFPFDKDDAVDPYGLNDAFAARCVRRAR